MSDEEILEGVKEIFLEKLGVDPEEIVLEAKIQDDLGADSLDQVEVVMALEEKFNIQIPDEDAEGIETIQEVVDYISKKIGAGG